MTLVGQQDEKKMEIENLRPNFSVRSYFSSQISVVVSPQVIQSGGGVVHFESDHNEEELEYFKKLANEPTPAENIVRCVCSP